MIFNILIYLYHYIFLFLLPSFLDNELHLTPVESVIPLSASLSHLDEYEARMKLPSSSSSTSSGTASRRSYSNEDVAASSHNFTSNTAAAKTIQVQFRKKETEEQVQARLNSYAHLQRQVDDEPWVNLKHFSSKVSQNRFGLLLIYQFFSQRRLKQLEKSWSVLAGTWPP